MTNNIRTEKDGVIITMAADETIIEGNTYPLRKRLKYLEFRWDGSVWKRSLNGWERENRDAALTYIKGVLEVGPKYLEGWE